MDKLVILDNIIELGLKEGDELNLLSNRNMWVLNRHDEDVSSEAHSVFTRNISINNVIANEIVDLGLGKFVSDVDLSEEKSTDEIINRKDRIDKVINELRDLLM